MEDGEPPGLCRKRRRASYSMNGVCKRVSTGDVARAGCLGVVMIGLFCQSLCAGELRLPKLPSLPVGGSQYGVGGSVSDEAEEFVQSSSVPASVGGNVKEENSGVRIKENGPEKASERKSEKIDYRWNRRVAVMRNDHLAPALGTTEGNIGNSQATTDGRGRLRSLSGKQKLGF